MGENSKIEWTDASWTPIRAIDLATGKIGWHCEHDTTGCEFCYSESMNLRLGTRLPFKPGHRSHVNIFLDEQMLLAPLRWKKPRMIFVCSMTDLFASFVTDEWIDRIFAVMALCPQHTFQVLTKRAERMREYFLHRLPNGKGGPHSGASSAAFRMWMQMPDGSIKPAWPLPNVWLGVSAERQQEADERIPHLLQTPAAIRFLSAEPLLGPIDLRKYLFGQEENGIGHTVGACIGWTPPLDWVIVGGESGSKARPFKIEWADSIVAQCKAAGVSCFVKQLGAVPMSDGYPLELRHRKGGNPKEWPERLNVREMPERVPA